MPGSGISRRRAFSTVSLLVALASLPWPVGAAVWRVTPRISASETLTDNVNLSADDRQAALVTRFSPGVNITERGARTWANLSYTLDGIIAVSGSGLTGGQGRNRSRLFHRLNASGNAELVKQHLFIDGQARRRQYATTLAGPIGIDNTAGFTNLSPVTVVQVSPYLTNHFGSFAESTLRYSYSRLFIDQAGTADTQTNRFSGTLQSGDAFSRLIWSLNASRTQTKAAGGTGSGGSTGAGGSSTSQFTPGTFSQAAATLGYRLTPQLSVSVTGGYQENDFQSFRNSISGPFWSVGFTWVPNQRGSLSASYGKRFFGSTTSLDLSYRRRTTLWQASFNQTIASLRNVILTDAGTIQLPPDCPLTDPACQPIEMAVLRPEAVQDIYVLRRRQASVTLFSARHSATLAYAFLRRTIERTGAESRQQGVTLSWNWRVKSNVSLTTSGGLQQIEPLNTPGEGIFWFTRLQLTYSLGGSPNVGAFSNVAGSSNVFVAYRHQSRDSSAGTFGYVENALTAGISLSF
ncbi:MAG: TIGR03016 family PEP-CTERM system-associated outer membrane protein [Nitrococcus sp.]|nr:TIGR03016 family PEP-CTERM system-associated outer membrane protein [Nitrococcus sp.]